MATPYWGDLPGPKVSLRSRSNQHSSSENYSSRAPRRQSQSPSRSQPLDPSAAVAPAPAGAPQLNPNRSSAQTSVTDAYTDSTLSPYGSPRNSYQGHGLAPRPETQIHTMTNYPPDIIEKRRLRASKNREEEEEQAAHVVSGAMPAAPDAPKGPPVSFRHPYGNGGLPYTLPKTGDPQQPDIPPSPGVMDAEPLQHSSLDRAKRASVSSNRRASSGSTAPLRTGSARDAANGYRKTSLGNEVDRRLFADARSPLQKLELTLDRATKETLAKEQKRARLEAAERDARQRASQGAGKDDAQPHTVRFKDDEVETEPASPRTASGPSSARPARRGGTSQDYQEGAQRQGSRSGRGTKPKPIATEVAQGTAVPHRNLSFRERAARQDIKLPNGGRDSPTTPPTTTPTGGYSLTRNGSNKLKKDPPGDPWFHQRHEVERKYGQVQPRAAPQISTEAQVSGASAAPEPVGPPNKRAGGSMRNRVPPLNTAVVPRRQPVRPAAVDDDQDSPITTGNSVNLSRQRQGSTSIRTPPHSPFPFTSDSTQHSASKSRAAAGAVVGAAAGAGTAAAIAGRSQHDGNGSDGEYHSDHEHNLSERFHRHAYKPGEGLYKPPQYLNEWKKGTVGTLSGTMLDLSDESTPTLDKGQTWWETPPSRRRGSTSSRPRRGEAFDGEYDETNGTQNSDDSGDGEGALDTGSQANRQSWSVHYDDVVPHAREVLGHQATANKRKARRQARLYSLGRSLTTPGEDREAACFSVLCSCFPCFSSPRPRRLSERTLLTRAARMAIRVPKFIASTRFKPPLYLKCGPLLRYCGMRTERISSRSGRSVAGLEREFWRGTVMIVTADEASEYDIAPTLRLFAQPMQLLPPPPAEVRGEVPLEYLDPVAGHPKLGRKGETCYVRPAYHLSEEKDHSRDDSDEGLFEKTRSPPDVDLPEGSTDAPGSFADRRKRSPPDGEKLGKYKDVRGCRLHAERGYTFWRFSVEVELRDKEQRIAYRINRGPATGFWVPAKSQSMNIMFHSCNGFSLSINPDELSGPDPMWRDVLNNHQSRPFHVMLGGGDQLYCDAVMRQTTHFQDWLMIRNPLHKHNAPFSPEMQDDLEAFYLERYCMWFSQGLFGLANSQIPMVNIYDDHDIIDGFGSYPDHFMSSPVFSGLGNVAFKYYMLFQHQSIVNETEETEPSWCLGSEPGPYIHERSRSLFMFLGSKIALLAVDCRTERKRDQVLFEYTREKLINRCYDEIIKGKTEHLLVLLGVPIAYPRLVWLENILTSRLLDPIKALGKTGLFGNVFNKFDGGVEVLDDLDDHWTAKNHKEERQIFIQDLQDLAADRSVRVTILGGDVHLAAIGQFYSNPKLEIAKHKDFRYMPNVISSAIVNTPPPDLMADVLNKRNKVHHLDKDTDEDMIPMFAHGVEGKPRNNKRLLPHRNWCSIREYTPGQTPPSSPPESSSETLSPVGSLGGGLIGGGMGRRLSKRKRGPSYRADVIDSRPPITAKGPGGLLRSLSSRGRRSDSDVPAGDQRPSTARRTLSLTRGDFGLFRRGSKAKRSKADDGGINGSWGDSDAEEEDDDFQDRDRGGGFLGAIGLRGGGGSYQEFSEGDDSYFTTSAPTNTSATRPNGPASKTARLLGEEAPPASNSRGFHQSGSGGGRGYGTTTTVSGPTLRQPVDVNEFRPKPFHRTPTSGKLNRARTQDVNIEGGLDITLNVEVSAKDPTGITVPYRLLVPRLWYDAAEGVEVELPETGGGAVKRLLSLSRGKNASKGKGVAGAGVSQGQGQGQRSPAPMAGSNGRGIRGGQQPAPGTAV